MNHQSSFLTLIVLLTTLCFTTHALAETTNRNTSTENAVTVALTLGLSALLLKSIFGGSNASSDRKRCPNGQWTDEEGLCPCPGGGWLDAHSGGVCGPHRSAVKW